MKNFVQRGDTITLTAPYNVASGAGLQVGSIFGIASGAASFGAQVEAALVGVFDLAKVSGEAWTAGGKVYWNNTSKLVTSDDDEGANLAIGVAILAAANPSSMGRVRLNGTF